MHNDSTYQSAIKTAIPPAGPGKQKELHDAHFNTRQVIWRSHLCYGHMSARYQLCSYQTVTVFSQSTKYRVGCLLLSGDCTPRWSSKSAKRQVECFLLSIDCRSRLL